MLFREGQILVHPFHGPLQLQSIDTRTVRGKTDEYLRLHALGANLTISVPSDRTDNVGLRPVLSPPEVAAVFDALRAPSIPLERQWSRRMKELQALLSTGRLDELVVIVRELIRRGVTGSGSAEGQMLRAARKRITTELVVALDGEAAEVVTQMITDAALGAASPSLVGENEGGVGEAASAHVAPSVGSRE